MAELIINIPDKLYEKIKAGNFVSWGRAEVGEAIKDGILLPENHGNIKDVDAIIDKFDETYREKVETVPDNLAEGFMQCEKLIKQAPAIIKANDGHFSGYKTEGKINAGNND